MEKLGTPRFFNSHSAQVRCVSYNPAERYIFASGGNDGNVCVYHAGRAELLNVYSVITSGINRNINAVRFTCDGKKILNITTSRRLSVLDTERGVQINSYENCAFNGRERGALATDPLTPYYAASSYVNGKGVTLYDLRMPLPLDFHFDFHTDPIRDIQYLDDSWPFNKPGTQSLITISSQGVCKITGIDGHVLHAFDFGHPTNSVVPTPEPFGSAAVDGFTSALLGGGTVISSYAPAPRCPNYGSSSSSSKDDGLPDLVDMNGTSSTNGNSSASNRRVRQRRSSFNVIRSGSQNSLMDHDGEEDGEEEVEEEEEDEDEDGPEVDPAAVSLGQQLQQLQARRNEIIFSLEGIRISSRSAAAGGGSSAGSSGSSVSNAGTDGSAHSNSSSTAGTASGPVTPASSAAIRHHIINHLNGQLSQRGLLNSSSSPDVVSSSSSSSSGASSSSHHTITISTPHIISSSGSSVLASPSPFRSSNLHQFLAMNFMPIRTSVQSAVVSATGTVPTVSPSQIYFHDRWDRNSTAPMPAPITFSNPVLPNSSSSSSSPSPTNPYRLAHLQRHHHHYHHNVHQNHPPPAPPPAPLPMQIWRLRYSSNGALLYACGDGGSVRRYRQYPGQQLKCLGELFHHRTDVYDMDISPYDEYLVTASKDKTVGLICLGSPNHGWTEYYELT